MPSDGAAAAENHAHPAPPETAPAAVMREMSADEIEKAMEGLQIEPPAIVPDAGGQTSDARKDLPAPLNLSQEERQGQSAAEGESHD
jgi:hypothetical protein